MANPPDIADARARSFVDGLKQFEDDGDASTFAEMFARDATTQRFDARGERRGEVETFWREYRDQFATVSTTFDNVIESGDAFAFEWATDATLANGHPMSYRGVTVVLFDGGDNVATLRTYYDSAQFAVLPVGTS
jgi:hypothetical protein